MRLRDLPMDVIQFEIFPYLDGISSLYANDVFRGDLDYRCPNKIPTHLILKHHLQMAIKSFNCLVKKEGLDANKLGPNISRIGAINIFRGLLSGKYDILLHHYHAFRQAVFNKVDDFSNPASPQYRLLTKGWKKGLLLLIQKLSHRLTSIPMKQYIQGATISYYNTSG